MVPLSHGTCHKCDMLSGKQRETYGKPRCQKTPLSLLQAPSKPLSLIIPVLGTARRGTKSRKVTKKVSISPRLCWLLFAKPDIPLPRSRTKMLRSHKGEKLLPSGMPLPAPRLRGTYQITVRIEGFQPRATISH